MSEQKIIPREPDEAMLDAGRKAFGSFYATMTDLWRAMYDAAPSAAAPAPAPAPDTIPFAGVSQHGMRADIIAEYGPEIERAVSAPDVAALIARLHICAETFYSFGRYTEANDCRDAVAMLRRLSAPAGDDAEWRTWGMIEVAIRNPNVDSWMRHWEGRALAAEERIDRHNEDCRQACSARGTCIDYTARGRMCPDCPQDWMIDDGARALAAQDKDTNG